MNATKGFLFLESTLKDAFDHIVDLVLLVVEVNLEMLRELLADLFLGDCHEVCSVQNDFDLGEEFLVRDDMALREFDGKISRRSYGRRALNHAASLHILYRLSGFDRLFDCLERYDASTTHSIFVIGPLFPRNHTWIKLKYIKLVNRKQRLSLQA